MAEYLTPKQLASIRHWSTYGQRGCQPSQRTTASDWETEGFSRPRHAVWDVKIEANQLPVLLLGFRPSTGSQLLPDMDWIKVGETIKMHTMTSASGRFDVTASNDKWFVYADGPEASGHARLHMYHSWTGHKMIELGLRVEPVFAGFGNITEITFETDADRIVEGSEEKAKEMAIEVCRWVLNVDLEPSSAVEYTADELEDAMSALPKATVTASRAGPGGRSIGGDRSPSRAGQADAVQTYLSDPNRRQYSSVREALEAD